MNTSATGISASRGHPAVRRHSSEEATVDGAAGGSTETGLSISSPCLLYDWERQTSVPSGPSSARVIRAGQAGPWNVRATPSPPDKASARAAAAAAFTASRLRSRSDPNHVQGQNPATTRDLAQRHNSLPDLSTPARPLSAPPPPPSGPYTPSPPGAPPTPLPLFLLSDFSVTQDFLRRVASFISAEGLSGMIREGGHPGPLGIRLTAARTAIGGDGLQEAARFIAAEVSFALEEGQPAERVADTLSAALGMMAHENAPASSGNGSGSSDQPKISRIQGANIPDFITTDSGAPIANNRFSTTVGPRGPTLFEDLWLHEKNAHLNREKAPERTVHAQGSGAHGVFKCEADLSDICRAKVFTKGKETEAFVRFSPTISERGTPELLRDVRGFAVKMYAEEGNWDLVGNNIPVFFVRDAISFPDIIHALRPNPQSNMQEWWRILDFLSFHPESLHIQTWLMDDYGIPYSYRHTNGYGVHTFLMMNDEGKETFVKFHWLTNQGLRWLDDEEAQVLGGKNHMHMTEDLFQSIKKGNFPSWTLNIQQMTREQAEALPFDPLDATKTWNEQDFPLRRVGTLTLTRNVNNYHNEVEQVAFAPSNLPPGILPSADKLLQGRLFAYRDAAQYRIGKNFEALPINAPRCPFQAMQQEMGAMNFQERSGEINYWPSNFDPSITENASGNKPSSEPLSGTRVRSDYPKSSLENDLLQPRERWLEIAKDEGRAKRFIRRVATKASDPRIPETLRLDLADMWKKVDPELGHRIQVATAEMVKVQMGKDTPYEKGVPQEKEAEARM